MIVEERIYTLHPGRVADYLKVYESEALSIQKPILGTMVGFFHTEIGPLNQIVHMWAYEDLKDRAERRARLQKAPGWQEYLQHGRPFMVAQENKILIPTAFSPVPGALVGK
jgi:hypothetical protein